MCVHFMQFGIPSISDSAVSTHNFETAQLSLLFSMNVICLYLLHADVENSTMNVKRNLEI